jgi:hypothetical protein
MRAAKLHGAAEALRSLSGKSLSLPYRADLEKRGEAIRARLGEAAFGAAWAEGQGMTLDQAIDYAKAE